MRVLQDLASTLAQICHADRLRFRLHASSIRALRATLHRRVRQRRNLTLLTLLTTEHQQIALRGADRAGETGSEASWKAPKSECRGGQQQKGITRNDIRSSRQPSEHLLVTTAATDKTYMGGKLTLMEPVTQECQKTLSKFYDGLTETDMTTII